MKKICLLSFFVIIVTACFSFGAISNESAAQNSWTKKQLILTNRYNEHYLSPYLYYFDVQKQHTTRDVLDLPGQPVIQDKTPHKIIQIPSERKNVWIGFDVQNRSSENKWGISFGTSADGRFGAFDSVKIFTASNQSEMITFDIKQNKNGIYALNFPELESTRVLINLTTSKALPSMLPLQLVEMTDSSFLKQYHYVYLFISLLIGLAFFFVAVSFLNNRYEFLYFSLYYLVFILILCVQNNLIFLNESMRAVMIPILYYGVALSALLTAKIFWTSKENDKIFKLLTRGFSALTLIIFVSGLFFLNSVPFLQSVLTYTAIVSIFFFIPITSILFSRNNHTATTPFMLGWFIFLFGILISMLPFLKIMLPVSTAMNAYWFALIPQAFFFFIATKLKVSDQNSDVISSKLFRIDESDSVSRLRQSRENKEQDRLLKVIDQERKILTELRKSEAKKTEEMRKSKELADQANKAKSAFLAVVTHEIRTPMTGIMGMVRLLMESNLSKEQKGYAQTIQDSSDAMLALLNDILDFEKIEQGKMSFETITFDLQRVIQGVATLMNGHAVQKNIELRTKIGDTLPQFVQGDPTRLRQVLLNLTGNAVKFTEEGHVTITAERLENEENQNEDMCEIYLSVTDSGIGISKDVQQSLFTPFSQANNSIARKFGGTGLGLAISKGLVEAMGSQININSNEGEGSTFFFILKMPTADFGNEEITFDKKSHNKIDKNIEPKNILVVDDNEINLNVVHGLLGNTPHKVKTTNTGEKAIELVKHDDYDLILMDIELTGMSGDEATKKIRGELEKTMPIIALTGNLMPDDVTRFKEAGMDDVLAKPIDPDALITLVNQKNYTKETDNSLPTNISLEIEEDAPKAPKNIEDKALEEDTLNTLKTHLKSSDIKEMLDDVVSKNREIIGDIHSLLQQDDTESISKKCHELRGMAGNFGFIELSRSAEIIEQAIKDNNKDAITAEVKTLETKEKRAKEALNTWLSNNLDNK